jgi:trimeric autotransporter adhesin
MRLTPAVLVALAASCSASAQTYTISTFAGSSPTAPLNVPGASASLSPPYGIAVDSKGNVFFTNGYYGYFILRLDATTGILTLAAGNGTAGFSGDDGLATSAAFNTPGGLAVDSAGNLYIADSANSRIRKVSNGVITTV